MTRSGNPRWRGWIVTLCVALALAFSTGTFLAASHLDSRHQVDAALSGHGQFVHAHPEDPHHGDDHDRADHARADVSHNDSAPIDGQGSSDPTGSEPHAHYSPTPQVASIPAGETSIRVAQASLNVRFEFQSPFRASQLIAGLDRPPRGIAVL